MAKPVIRKDSPGTVAVMQPYFFPYLGHFSLIQEADYWVVFDIVPFKRKTWMTRNRVLHPEGGWKYISVPVGKGVTGRPVHFIDIGDVEFLRRKIQRNLQHYKDLAPYYETVNELVDSVFCRLKKGTLPELNVAALETISEYIGLEFSYDYCSELALHLPETMQAGEWAPEITARVGGSRYINPISGFPLFDERDFSSRGITLSFLEINKWNYQQQGFEFVPDLSIIDVLMWNDAAAVKEAVISKYLIKPHSKR